LGNIVPACEKCNAAKASKDYREFLGDNKEAVSRIEKYMDDKNYVPLTDSDQIKKILDMAYEEVAMVADRYIAIINELFGVK
jgi:NADH:ubiquinone oxidoreductase subunit E